MATASSACTRCLDVRDSYMERTGETCANWAWGLANRCNRWPAWREAKTCQLSCFRSGSGYDGDICCPPRSHVAPVFLGTNVPWNKFGYDIGGGAWDASWFDSYFASVSGRSNSVRFLLHGDGRASPMWADSGHAVALSDHGDAVFRAELGELIALARKHRLVLQICLWSFDMCNKNGFPIRSDIIADEGKASAYIDRVLAPILDVMARADGSCEHCILEVRSSFRRLS
jgi:hypothetical protein